MTLVEFLLARIAEDEASARAALPGPWEWERPTGKWNGPEGYIRSKPDGFLVVSNIGAEYNHQLDIDATEAEHIVRWDPARVLAECEAKRRIVEGFAYVTHYESDDDSAVLNAAHYLRLLALPYADHPDYREEWKP
jgi:hypothetical protein